ncbi:phosphoporin PhoE [Enterobacter hormaechei]|uniref:porin n=1 Tax=Enterobacter hormaechei TaxID=158836 RepID=UPI0013C08337|nr:porin [Enterobacter hormaechei]NDU69080.1 phosphoporin PhoE [Enterobacter hormaechei]
MKLKLVAVAVTSMLAAGVVNAAEVFNKDGNKLDLYGKVTGLHYFSDDAGSDGDKTYVRLGFKGETQINDQLTGYGQWEYEFKGNRSEAQGSDGNKTRLAYAGLKFDEFGSFDYGRNYGVAYDIGAWTDVLPEFGGDTWTQTDGFMTGRTTGVATYRNTDFFGLVDGLNVAAQYQGKNDRDDITESNGDGWGLSSTYEFDGFGLRPSIAYLKSKGKDIGSYGDQDLVEYVDVGASYYFNKNMSTYVDYKINLVDDSQFTKDAKVATDNIVAVGLTYQF